MPKSQPHWGYDLLTVVVVVAIGAFVFWALPVQAQTTASADGLYREVFFPAMSLVSDVTPSPFEQRTPTAPHQPVAAKVGYARVLDAARAEARARLGRAGRRCLPFARVRPVRRRLLPPRGPTMAPAAWATSACTSTRRTRA